MGILAASAGPRASAQVTAAVLLYRALTYLPPIPLGAAAWLIWRHAPALIHPTPATAAPASLPRRAHNGRQPHQAPAAMTTFRQPPPLTLPASGSGTARPGGLIIEYQRAGNSPASRRPSRRKAHRAARCRCSHRGYPADASAAQNDPRKAAQ